MSAATHPWKHFWPANVWERPDKRCTPTPRRVKRSGWVTRSPPLRRLVRALKLIIVFFFDTSERAGAVLERRPRVYRRPHAVHQQTAADARGLAAGQRGSQRVPADARSSADGGPAIEPRWRRPRRAARVLGVLRCRTGEGVASRTGRVKGTSRQPCPAATLTTLDCDASEPCRTPRRRFSFAT